MNPTLAERVRGALMKRAPDIGISAWRASHAAKLDTAPETFEKWMRSEPAEPSAAALLALFDHFGADFENEVRGRAVARTLEQWLDTAAHAIGQARKVS